MKNKLLLLICALLFLTLVACGNDGDVTETDGTDNTESNREGVTDTKADTDTEKTTETEADGEDVADAPKYEILSHPNDPPFFANGLPSFANGLPSLAAPVREGLFSSFYNGLTLNLLPMISQL